MDRELIKHAAIADAIAFIVLLVRWRREFTPARCTSLRIEAALRA